MVERVLVAFGHTRACLECQYRVQKFTQLLELSIDHFRWKLSPIERSGNRVLAKSYLLGIYFPFAKK